MSNAKIPHLKDYKDSQLKEKLKPLMESSEDDEEYVAQSLLGMRLSQKSVL